MFDSSNLSREKILIGNENEKVVGTFRIETVQDFWVDEFSCLRSKGYSFKYGNDIKNKLEGISEPQSKSIKLKNFINVDLEQNIKTNVRNILKNLLFVNYVFQK